MSDRAPETLIRGPAVRSARSGLEFSRPLATAVLVAAIVLLMLLLPQRPGDHPGGLANRQAP